MSPKPKCCKATLTSILRCCHFAHSSAAARLPPSPLTFVDVSSTNIPCFDVPTVAVSLSRSSPAAPRSDGIVLVAS
jgi:hypothetical protein